MSVDPDVPGAILAGVTFMVYGLSSGLWHQMMLAGFQRMSEGLGCWCCLGCPEETFMGSSKLPKCKILLSRAGLSFSLF